MSVSSLWKTAGILGVIVVMGGAGYAWNESKSTPDTPPGPTRSGSSPGVTLPTPSWTPSPSITSVTQPQGQCDDPNYPTEVPMRIGGVTRVPDLVMCANEQGNEVTVENTSKSTVWLLKDDTINYWRLEQDLDKPLTTQLFRQSLRRKYLHPYLTIEPGLMARLSGPAGLEFYVNVEEQALWQSSALLAQLVEAAKDKYGDEVTSRARELVEGNSKYRKAALDCGGSAFDVGGKISAYQQDPSHLVLSDVYGAYGEATRCYNSLKEANQAAKEERSIPLVELTDIEHIGSRSGWAERTDNVFRFLFKVGSKAVK